MEEKVYDLLKSQVQPEEILEEIALMFYSAVTAHQFLHPKVMKKLLSCRSFEDSVRMFDQEEPDEDLMIFGEILDLIEQELDEKFDEAEDSVKEQLVHGPMAQTILEDFRKKNVLMVQKVLHPDQIEQMYVGAFRKYDRLKEQLEKRILALSPAKAYYQGEQIWQKQRRIQNILMDDAELVQEFQKDFDQKDLEDLLAFKYYQAVQFGRHYKAEGMDEEENETGLEEIDEDMDELEFLQSQREPEMLVPDGDLRDQEYEYACELLEEYTGRRIFPVEGDGDMAYWSIYEDEFSDLIDTKLLQSLDTTLARLAEEAPEKLKNLADQYEIGQDDLKNGAEYAVRTNEFAYYYSGLFDSILFNFGEEKAAEVFRRGRELAQKASGA